jgi:hypothetical protein
VFGLDPRPAHESSSEAVSRLDVEWHDAARCSRPRTGSVNATKVNGQELVEHSPAVSVLASLRIFIFGFCAIEGTSSVRAELIMRMPGKSISNTESLG